VVVVVIIVSQKPRQYLEVLAPNHGKR